MGSVLWCMVIVIQRVEKTAANESHQKHLLLTKLKKLKLEQSYNH